MKNHLEPGIYQHYKGNLYLVLEVARHSETLEPYVIYRQLYGGYGLWVRPITMFQEFILHEGESKPRFKFLKKCEIPKV